MPPVLEPWSINAINLAEHSDNPVHTVAGGLAAGYGGAVVAGTTVYAYLSRPAAAAWGVAWLAHGFAEVCFLAPVLADEHVDIVPVVQDGVWVVEARTSAATCATLRVDRDAVAVADPVGDRLAPMVLVLDDRWSGYAGRAGEDLPLYGAENIVHPAVWLSLANRVFSTQLVDGAWVHTRSVVQHVDLARPGDTVVIESWETDRFSTQAGERAVVDVRMTVDDQLVAVIEHEAIVRLSGEETRKGPL